ncbi:hypothetical protein LCGC14_1488760 [marine sediment metagenome]|uniref:Uncharacterized protein n=1 Tax=marine sediment metagenome TaxID=412755 RepID=A0A0F9LMS9_9ZZZZ
MKRRSFITRISLALAAIPFINLINLDPYLYKCWETKKLVPMHLDYIKACRLAGMPRDDMGKMSVVEVLNNKWIPIQFKNIKKGDKFRMIRPGGYILNGDHSRPGNPNNISVNIALNDACPCSDSYGVKIQNYAVTSELC